MKRILGLALTALSLSFFVGCTDDELPITATISLSSETPTVNDNVIATASVVGGEGVAYYWQVDKDANDVNTFVEGSKEKNFGKLSAGTHTINLYVWSSTQTKTVSKTVTVKSADGPTTWDGVGEIHSNITASLFWVGEGASDENGDISNYGSAWRSSWTVDYGLEDKPTLARDGNGFPTSGSYKNTENPYYFALPYNDLGSLVSDGDGVEVIDNSLTNNGLDWGYKNNRKTVVYWNGDSLAMSSNTSKSMVKNRWIKITANGNTAYAQWEDAGPFYYNDVDYVFGSAAPLNQNRLGAGIDLSPAVMYKLFGNANKGEATVSWQFVNESEVPADPWKKVVTKTQCAW